MDFLQHEGDFVSTVCVFSRKNPGSSMDPELPRKLIENPNKILP